MQPDDFDGGGDTDALWDANDVAHYLKASRSWVYQKAEAGLLPYLRIGGLLRFDPRAIRAWATDGIPADGQVLVMHGIWRKISSSAQTKAQARRLAQDYERGCERQRLGLDPLPPVDGGGTLAELLQWWLDTFSNGSTYHRGNESTLNKHLFRSELAVAVDCGNAGTDRDVSAQERP